MNRFSKTLIYSAALFIPVLVQAHGLIKDGDGSGALALHDLIELGGVILASIGLILYTIDAKRKEKKKNDSQNNRPKKNAQ